MLEKFCREVSEICREALKNCIEASNKCSKTFENIRRSVFMFQSNDKYAEKFVETRIEFQGKCREVF